MLTDPQSQLCDFFCDENLGFMHQGKQNSVMMRIIFSVLTNLFIVAAKVHYIKFKLSRKGPTLTFSSQPVTRTKL